MLMEAQGGACVVRKTASMGARSRAALSKGKSGRSNHLLPRGIGDQSRLRDGPNQPRQRPSSPKAKGGSNDCSLTLGIGCR
jgi:hypothetical protein